MFAQFAKFFQSMGEMLKNGFEALKKISAPFVGISIALPVSVFFFTAYLFMEVVNLGEGELRRRYMGEKKAVFDPTLQAIAKGLFGIAVGVWSDYALKPYTESIRELIFSEFEKSFAKYGRERVSAETPNVVASVEKSGETAAKELERASSKAHPEQSNIVKFANNLLGDSFNFKGSTEKLPKYNNTLEVLEEERNLFPNSKRVEKPQAKTLETKKNSREPS